MTIDTELQLKIELAIKALQEAASDYAPAVLAHSFGVEDMVVLDMIDREQLEIAIFTLDTGRLPDETYQLMQKVRDRYNRNIQYYFPDGQQLEIFLEQHGPDAIFNSVEQRQQCCHIRKVLPLQRALEGKQSWITGLRREQAISRNTVEIRAWDEVHQLQKFSPLAEWTTADVWAYVRHYDVPYNVLHDQNYPSIGCAPCSRAISVGEDIRAGRWWWEDEDGKECGLHPLNKNHKNNKKD